MYFDVGHSHTSIPDYMRQALKIVRGCVKVAGGRTNVFIPSRNIAAARAARPSLPFLVPGGGGGR